LFSLSYKKVVKMKKYYEFYKLGNKIGLNKKDIKNVLENPNIKIEQPSLSIGGPDYPGTYYGTISIKDF